MPDQAPSRLAPQETVLADTIERLDKIRSGRLAVHIRLSQLSRAHSREHFLELAAAMFATATRAIDGQLFTLLNHDLVFLAREVPLATLDKAIDRLRALFSDDPIFVHKNAGREPFCTWYRLESDYDALRATSRQWLKDCEQAEMDYTRKNPAEGLAPIHPDLLARIERSLEKIDVTNLARRQMVCNLVEGQQPQPLFEEIYVAINELQNAVTPGINWLADPWLFQYLSHTLDKRVMAMLTKNGPPQDRPFSINLNVSSVLSPEFRRFDEIISPQLRGRLVIEFNKLDVFADMGAFMFARDYLRERGFRICLDGLSHLTLPYCNRTRLGFDLIKIFWMPDGVEDMLPEMIPATRSIIMEAGQARTILCRCENARAIEVGQQLGIVMFQGRYVDHLYATVGRPGGAAVTPLRRF